MFKLSKRTVRTAPAKKPVPAATTRKRATLTTTVESQPKPEPEPSVLEVAQTPAMEVQPQPVVSLLEQMVASHKEQPKEETPELQQPAEPVRHFVFDDAPDTVEGLQLENAQLRQVIRNLETEITLYKANVRAPKKAGGAPVSINRSESAKKSWDTIRAKREAAKLAQAQNATAAA